MTNNGADLLVNISVAALDADWGKYLIFMDTWDDGGSGDNDNPWGRDIGGLGGMDIFAGSWLDGGGGVVTNEYGAAGWGDLPYATGISIDWSSDTIQITFFDLVTDLIFAGITEIDFEVATTGGNWGDPAIDLLGGEGTQGGWAAGSTSTDLMHYELPAPGALALLAMAGLTRRRRH